MPTLTRRSLQMEAQMPLAIQSASGAPAVAAARPRRGMAPIIAIEALRARRTARRASRLFGPGPFDFDPLPPIVA